ncbi:MAG: chloride channel protein [Clostridiales bacterium]|nr:chloride channel protein [Clostridiales bacterium]
MSFDFNQIGIEENIEEEVKSTKDNIKTFSKWMIIATIVGIMVGVVGSIFHIAVEWATESRMEHWYLLFFLPVGGALIAFLYKTCGMDKEKGTNAVLMAVRSAEMVSFKTAPLIFISTVITHWLGGSSGREGAALQLGGSIAGTIGRSLHLKEQDMRIITICGMSAGFSALFGTPVASVVFAMEVVHVGVMQYSAIVPGMLASAFSFLVAHYFGIEPTAFFIMGIPKLSAVSIFQVLALAIACAVVSVIFCLAMKYVSKFYKVYIPNKVIRGAVGGIVVIVLTFLVGSYDYNGAGMDVITRALQGEARAEAFLLKILFTSVTLCAGFKGGEIVPAFFTGATFGNVAGKVLGLHPSFSAGIGLIAVFCGVTNCPLTSMFLSIELFGVNGLIFFAIACAVCYMLSGYYGLYSAQKIVYSKIKIEKIDRGTH